MALSLTIPKSDTLSLSDGDSPQQPRRVISPLLEVRRPHCTLNCDHCNNLLEERFKHMSKYNLTYK